MGKTDIWYMHQGKNAQILFRYYRIILFQCSLII